MNDLKSFFRTSVSSTARLISPYRRPEVCNNAVIERRIQSETSLSSLYLRYLSLFKLSKCGEPVAVQTSSEPSGTDGRRQGDFFKRCIPSDCDGNKGGVRKVENAAFPSPSP